MGGCPRAIGVLIADARAVRHGRAATSGTAGGADASSMKPSLHETDAMVHRPASQTAALLKHGSAKHCTPGVGHFGSGSARLRARQSQPVQVNEKVRQSAFVRHSLTAWARRCRNRPARKATSGRSQPGGGLQMPLSTVQNLPPEQSALDAQGFDAGGSQPNAANNPNANRGANRFDMTTSATLGGSNAYATRHGRILSLRTRPAMRHASKF